MKKTLTTELIMTILWVLLGVLGFYFLAGTVKTWLLPLYTAVVLLAYLVRWQFLVAAGILLPMVTALLTLHNGFSWTAVIIEIVMLMATGLLICFSYQKWKWSVHSSLVFGIVLGRVFGGLIAWLLSAVFAMGSFSNLFTYTMNSITGDIWGIAFQLAFVPLVVSFVFRKIYKTGKRR